MNLQVLKASGNVHFVIIGQDLKTISDDIWRIMTSIKLKVMFVEIRLKSTLDLALGGC